MHWLAPVALLGVLMAAASSSRRKKLSPPAPALVALIRREAALAGVPLQVALAFARVESNFNVNAQGDLDWPKKKPANYRVLVTEGRPTNPFRGQPELWHSYGLYQLHAAHHVKGDEDPRVLLDPTVNIPRAMTAIARLLQVAGGDPVEARFRYVGCGEHGAKCSDSERARIRERLLAALAEFQGVT